MVMTDLLDYRLYCGLGFFQYLPVVGDEQGKHQVHHWSLRERLEILFELP